MAKHKKLRSTYISKGQRKCTARKTINAMRRDRRENPSIKSIFQSSEHRRTILGRPKDKNLAVLYKKYVEEDRIKSQAENLYRKFQAAGIHWAACVQAVKTDHMGQLEMRYGSVKGKTGK